MKNFDKNVLFTVERSIDGYWAYTPDLPVHTYGETFAELKYNAVEAFNYFMEDTGEKINENNINLEIDLKQFFQYYRVLNAKFIARRIGMNETLLSQYVQGRKKPSPRQTRRILMGIQEIGKELSNLHLFVE